MLKVYNRIVGCRSILLGIYLFNPLISQPVQFDNQLGKLWENVSFCCW